MFSTLVFSKKLLSPMLYSYSLPAEKYQDEILKVIQQNRTTIIKGPTGCGKSTFIPFLLKDKKVAVIEPRRIAVTSVYNTLSPKIPGLGYKMRFSKKMNQCTTMIIYTDGSFLNDIDASADYDYIIVDEVHERSLRTDMILSILKLHYRNKLVLMSATLDTTRIEKFFGAVTYTIPGDGFPLTVKYLDHPISNYITECYLTVKKILRNRDAGEKKDILVFLPGEEDINEVSVLCRRIPAVSVYRVHSAMSDRDQMKIYEESSLTKVILSTNICETSLTIPNVKYVIDTGLHKTKVFDEISHLGIQSITRESAIQRTGRCNRLGPGVCYKLYMASQALPRYTPEIVRSDLTTAFLHLISLRKNILAFEFIDFPPIKNVLLAIEFLINKSCIQMFYKGCPIESLEKLEGSLITDFVDTSAVKEVTFRITGYGRRLVHHPFDAHLSHFYEQCVAESVGYYGSIVVSLVSQEGYNFLGARSERIPDILYLVELYEGYQETEAKHDFCKQRGVPIKGMETAVRISKALDASRKGDIEHVQRIFSRCFSHNLCSRKEDGSYFMHRINKNVFIHPTSGFFKRKDGKIVLIDVLCTTKAYARIVGKYYG